jgi:hypothetical protein
VPLTDNSHEAGYQLAGIVKVDDVIISSCWQSRTFVSTIPGNAIADVRKNHLPPARKNAHAAILIGVEVFNLPCIIDAIAVRGKGIGYNNGSCTSTVALSVPIQPSADCTIKV